jgi:hypothetical protein
VFDESATGTMERERGRAENENYEFENFCNNFD